MVLLNDSVEAKKFDVRVIERNVQRGFIKAEDAEKSAKTLPDDSENALYVSIQSLADDGSENGANGSH